MACRNVNTVITTAVARLDVDPTTAQATNLDGYLQLIDAAKAAGVKRFIFTSVLGSDPDSPAPFVAAKGKVEQSLRASGIPYTILAPDAFMEHLDHGDHRRAGLAGRAGWLVARGRDRHSFVATGRCGCVCRERC